LKHALFALLIAAVPALPAAALTQDEARRCAVMAKTFEGKSAEIADREAARAEAAAAAEAAGETWETAEAMRNFGEAQAAEADAARATYDAAKRRFEGHDAALRSATQMLNRDIAEYNRTCVSE